MKVVSIINYKGGVGKTTITSNLVAGLAQKGYKVLAIDLDPQSNLTFSFVKLEDWKNKYAEKKTIKNWFKDSYRVRDFKELIVKPNNINKDNLDIICSHIGLIDTDLDLATRLSGATNREQKSNFIDVHNILRKGLKDIENEGYDVVLIDCPPSFSIATRNALVASDYYMVPVKLDYLSTLGLKELNRHIEELKSDYNSNVADKDKSMDLQLLGIVCNMVSKQGVGLISQEEIYKGKLNNLNFKTFKSTLRENKTMHASAPEDGIPVILKKPSGNTQKLVKQELEDLLKEFIERLGI